MGSRRCNPMYTLSKSTKSAHRKRRPLSALSIIVMRPSSTSAGEHALPDVPRVCTELIDHHEHGHGFPPASRPAHRNRRQMMRRSVSKMTTDDRGPVADRQWSSWPPRAASSAYDFGALAGKQVGIRVHVRGDRSVPCTHGGHLGAHVHPRTWRMAA